MTTMRLFSLLTASLLALIALASAQSRVLYDPRQPTPEPRITEQERARIKYLGGLAFQAGAWKADSFTASLCQPGNDFRISGVAPGSFTALNTRQTAYLYTYCRISRAEVWQGLVVIQGNDVVANYAFKDHLFGMYAVKDINRNGYTELALEGGFTGQGITAGWLDVVELKPTRRSLAQLGVFDDNCGAVESGAVWTGQVIRVTPGKTPTYTAQQISGACENQRTALKTGPIRPITAKPAPTGWTVAPTQ